MPKNNGKCPKAERVDIRFANNRVVRNVDPKGWRWGEAEKYPAGYGYNIESWQPVQSVDGVARCA